MVTQAKRALRGSSILFAAMMAANIVNYLYALVLGRYFGPVAYGAYASFMSLFLLITLLPLTLQQIGARFRASGSGASAYTSRLALIVGGGVGLLMAATSGWLDDVINLPQTWLIGLGLFLPAYALLGVYRGEAQGEENFGLLGSNLVLEHVIKVALTPLALLVVPGASGAVLATLLSLPGSLLQLLRRTVGGAVDAALRVRVRRFAWPVFGNLAAQAVIINSDVLMVNALLPATDAGLYAAVALIGRALFYGSWAVGAAAFPMVARMGRDKHQQMLTFALAMVGAVCLGVTAFCALFPELVIRLLVGDAYLAAAALVGPYALMTSLYALANVVSNHYLALGNHLAGYLPIVFAVAQVVLIVLFHDSTLTVVGVQIWVKGLLLAALLLGAFAGAFRKGEGHVVPKVP